jgi:hypothetical protein
VDTCSRVGEAKAVDEVKDIADKAEAMRVYARQAKNPQLEADAWEIRKRAQDRLGQLSAALDKAQATHGEVRLPNSGNQKSPKRSASRPPPQIGTSNLTVFLLRKKKRESLKAAQQ